MEKEKNKIYLTPTVCISTNFVNRFMLEGHYGRINSLCVPSMVIPTGKLYIEMYYIDKNELDSGAGSIGID